MNKIIFNLFCLSILIIFKSNYQISTMSVQSIFQASKSKLPNRLLLSLAFFSTGCILGYIKSSRQSKIDNESYNESNLKQYISEQHINHTINTTQRPAIIYYYQPMQFHHFIVRHGFIKCSTLCKDKGDFYMVNLTKKLGKALDQLQHVFPISEYMMEIRWPKGQCEVVYSDGERVTKEVERREFFNHTYRKSGGVEHFLEQNGLIQPKDPFADFVNLTKSCLFQPIKQ